MEHTNQNQFFQYIFGQAQTFIVSCTNYCHFDVIYIPATLPATLPAILVKCIPCYEWETIGQYILSPSIASHNISPPGAVSGSTDPPLTDLWSNPPCETNIN